METVLKMFDAFTHLFSFSFSSFFPYVFSRYIFARAVTKSIIHINVIVSSVPSNVCVRLCIEVSWLSHFMFFSIFF